MKEKLILSARRGMFVFEHIARRYVDPTCIICILVREISLQSILRSEFH